MTIPYLTGTVSIPSGSKTVTGTGTAWATALIVGGVFFCNGLAVPIASVNSDTQLTLALGWPGAAVEAQPYALVRDTDYARQSVANATALAEYIRRLDNDILQALADVAPAANTLIVFTGAGKAETLQIASLFNRSNHTGNAGQLPGVRSINGGPIGSARNKIINGCAEIAQRGTTFNIPSGQSAYTADRWYIWNQTNQAVTVECSVPVTYRGSPRFPSFKIHCPVAPTSGNVFVGQKIEGVDTLAGKQATMSFAHGSTEGFTAQAYLIQAFGHGGSAEALGIPAGQNVTFKNDGTLGLTKLLFNLATTEGKTFGAGNYLEWRLHLPIRSTARVTLTTMSLVEGDATQEDDPFAPRHIQQEMALCQRYYEKTVSVVLPPALLANVYPQAFWKVTKRVPPTLAVTPTYGTGAAFQLGDDPLNMFFQITGHSAVNQAIVYGDAEL